MADTDFMDKKYTFETLVAHFAEEIKALRPLANNPAEQTKLQYYYQAASTFKNVSIMDLVKFALSWGRGEGRSQQLKDALFMLLGYKTQQPSQIDVAYLRVFLDYVSAFKENRGNLKDWLLRFVLSSRFSPLYRYFEEAITHVIEDTQNRIISYEATIR